MKSKEKKENIKSVGTKRIRKNDSVWGIKNEAETDDKIKISDHERKGDKFQ